MDVPSGLGTRSGRDMDVPSGLGIYAVAAAAARPLWASSMIESR